MKVKVEHIYIIVFIAIAYLLLPAMNSDYLFAIQENSVFIKGRTFMADIVSDPHGGWLAWVSCYLTQFFYYPWLGGSIIIAIWVVIYLLLLRTFTLKGKWSFVAILPMLCLLFRLLDYGYWIYYTKSIGYAFSGTLLLFAISFTSCLLTEILRMALKRRWYKNYSYAVFAVCFIFGTLMSGGWHLRDHQSEIGITMRDKNFKHELRMYRAIDEFRYEDALKEMQEEDGEPTNLMVLLKNIALMHTERITDMFKTNNCGIVPNTGDSLDIRISQLAAPLVYYQFGQMNFAYFWALSNAVTYGQSFRNLKMMVRSAIFSGDFDVAKKYLTMLKTSTFYKDWAREHEEWIYNSTKFVQSIDNQYIGQLMNDDVNMLDNDNGLCEKYIIDHFSDLIHPATPLLEDVIMCMSLWGKDEYAFPIHFYNYVQRHPNATIPELYQEGAILLCNSERSPIELYDFPFDQIVSDKFNRFVQDYNALSQQNVDDAEMAKRMKSLYGGTYWWYYYFYDKFNIY